MIHYNVWFSFKDGVDEEAGIAVVRRFLREVSLLGESGSFQLLRNNSQRGSKMPRFQAVVAFADDDALSRAMQNQHERGIHAGSHGKVMDVVSEFRVEIFRVIPPPAVAMEYACEI